MAAVAAAVVIGVSNWVVAVAHHGPASRIEAPTKEADTLILRGSGADLRRSDLLRRATFFAPASASAPETADSLTCRHVPDPPSGTSPKFTCVLEDGRQVKVKYGRNPEIHAEVAGSRLLHLLGFPADIVTLVPHLRCEGCPRYPFAGAFVVANSLTRRLLASPAEATGYTDFEWVSVEHRFPAPAIETETARGWHWWEIEGGHERGGKEEGGGTERRAEVDALKLLAVFLAHWDNKPENQRLVCLDEDVDEACARPMGLIQDLGASFGPTKVNLARWQELPIWYDRASCTVSMRSLPYHGGSFPDSVISEEGRALMAVRLAGLDDEAARGLFADARFPQFHSGTDDRKDLDAWVAAFRHRADQIVTATCPRAASPSRP